MLLRVRDGSAEGPCWVQSCRDLGWRSSHHSYQQLLIVTPEGKHNSGRSHINSMTHIPSAHNLEARSNHNAPSNTRTRKSSPHVPGRWRTRNARSILTTPLPVPLMFPRLVWFSSISGQSWLLTSWFPGLPWENFCDRSVPSSTFVSSTILSSSLSHPPMWWPWWCHDLKFYAVFLCLFSCWLTLPPRM